MENKIYQTDDIPDELFRRLYPINSLLYCPSDAMPKVTTIQIRKATGVFLIREVEEDEEEDEVHIRELVKKRLRENLENIIFNGNATLC